MTAAESSVEAVRDRAPRVGARSLGGGRSRRLVTTLLRVLPLAGIAACAPGANSSVVHAGDVPGFWLGLWHGYIALFTFVVSLFDDRVGIYEIRNAGHLYDFGFVVGAMLFWGGGHAGARGNTRWRRRERKAE